MVGNELGRQRRVLVGLYLLERLFRLQLGDSWREVSLETVAMGRAHCSDQRRELVRTKIAQWLWQCKYRRDQYEKQLIESTRHGG